MKRLGVLLLTLLLSACLTTVPSKSREEVAQNIKVEKGYPGCRECQRVKTYASPVLASVNKRDYGGGRYLLSDVNIIYTNYTQDNRPNFYLVLALTADSTFVDKLWVWEEMPNGKRVLLTKSENNGAKCYQNLTRHGCVWRLHVQLSKESLKAYSVDGIKLHLSHYRSYKITANDGYKKFDKNNDVTEEASVYVEPFTIKGYLEGLQKLGAENELSRSDR